MTTTTTTTADASGRGDWRHAAACRGVDPELFHPVAAGGPLLDAHVAQAKAVCAGCLVRAECLAFALVALPYGVAGGMTPAERRQHRAAGRRRSAARVARPVGGSDREMAAAGRAALQSGRPVREVAREFGVTERTADRWAAQVRAESTGGAV